MSIQLSVVASVALCQAFESRHLICSRKRLKLSGRSLERAFLALRKGTWLDC